MTYLISFHISHELADQDLQSYPHAYHNESALVIFQGTLPYVTPHP
jgi:hypothetical protein